jgi:hypothetical protein
MTELHIFNWYVTSKMVLCGDVCVRPYRHNDYIAEKTKGTCHDTIRKRDNGCLDRSFVFIQEPVVKYDATHNIVQTRGGRYTLVNMDGYFLPRYDVIMARLKQL